MKAGSVAGSRPWLLACVVGLLIVLLGGMLASLAGAESPTAQRSKVTLKIGWMESPDNMNPFLGWSNNVYEIYNNEYLGLCGRDTRTLQLDDKGLAKSWEVSADGLTWTFHLNQGITWHDGEPLTAEDVAFSYHFVMDSRLPAFIATCKGIKDVVAVDRYTVKIICTRPMPNLTRVGPWILPNHIWSRLSPQHATTEFQNPPPVIGNGPWQVVDFRKDDFLRMVAYKDFYLGPPVIDEILFVVYQNADTMVQDLKSGELDAAYGIPPAQYELLGNTPGIAVTKYIWFNWDHLAFNCYEGESKGHPVLRDPHFRVALEYAIDRDALVSLSRNGYAIPGWTFMPPDNWTDPDSSWQPPDGVRRDFDLEKARQVLDEAGYADGDGDGIREYKGRPITLRLWAETVSPEVQREAKLIAGWFREVGVNVKLAVYDDAVYYDGIWNYEGATFVPDFDMYIWEWDGYIEAGLTLDCFTSAQIEGWNEMAWSNAEFDRLDVLQNEALDVNKRAELIRQMQQVMYEDAPAIVLTHAYRLAAYRTDRWQGWERANYGRGPAFNMQINPWAYYNLRPRTAAATESGASSSWIVAVIVAALAAAGFFLVGRRRRRRVEEE